MFDNVRSNVVVNIVRTLVLTILSFVTFPWVCRCLGESQMGLYQWAATFVSYFLILAKIGIPNIAVRECVKVRDDKEKFSNKVQSFFLLQLITTLISFLLLCAVTIPLAKVNSSFANAQSIIFILSLNFLSGAFSFEWVYIALEKQFYMSIRSIVALTISSILIIMFINYPEDIYVYALIAISVTVITTIANLANITKYVSFKKTMPYTYKELIKPLIVVSILTLGLSLYNQTDTFILGLIDESKRAVGNYSVGIKGIDIIIGIITALSTVFIPRSAYTYNLEDKRFFKRLNRYSVNICLFIVLPASVTMAALAYPLCTIMSGSTGASEYADAPIILMALSLMMITYSLSDIIYGQILLPMKKEKFYMFSIIGGIILNIVLSLLFGLLIFKDRPAFGVAIGTSVTDILVLIVLLTTTWKYSKDAIFNKNSLKLLIATIAVLIASIPLYMLLHNAFINTRMNILIASILEIVITLLVDAVIYISILFFAKEELVRSLFRKKMDDLENNNA